MNRDPDERAQPDGGRVPDEFDAIVAAWVREGEVPAWPDDRASPADALFDPDGSGRSGPGTDGAPPDPPTGRPTEPGPDLLDAEDPLDRHRTGDTAEAGPPAAGAVPGSVVPGSAAEHAPPPPRQHIPPVAPEDEHFVPPEPPPLPRLGPPALVGLFLMALGLVLVTTPGWVGVPQAYGLPLGLVTMAAGLGWLVLRLWPDPPSGDHDDEDDGAIV